MSWQLVSPIDHQSLTESDDGLVSEDGLQTFPLIDGIPQLIGTERIHLVDEFSSAYAAVRVAEGRASEDGDYYRSLPYIDVTGNFGDQWRRRAATFDRLLIELGPKRLRIIDAGAGNCWLASRLTAAGHEVLAVDVNDDDFDGLRASRHYREKFPIARAEADALPVADASAEVVIFNAAAHYLDLAAVTSEASRVIADGGRLIIADSPVYNDVASGQAMVAEMSDHIRRLGVSPATYPGAGFFTRPDLDATELVWRRIDLDGGGLRRLKRKFAGRRVGRELATLPILVATIDRRSTEGLP